MNHLNRSQVWSLAAFAALVWVFVGGTAQGQEATDQAPAKVADATADASAGSELSVDQARLADRYERLEIVLARLAELSAATDPRRAKVLREAIAKSREEGIDQRFESIVSLLEGERLSSATGRQSELQKELDELLTLLLKADRDRELDSQHKRIKAYLKEVGRLIRLEKGLQARTEGGDDAKRLAEDQKQVGDQTGDLGKSISDTEKTDSKSGEGKAGDDKKSGAKEGDDKKDEAKAGEKAGDKKAGEQPADGAKPAEAGKPSDSGKPGDSGKPSQAKPSESKPGEPSEGQPSEGKPSGGQPGQQGQPGQPGQPGESGESSPSQEQQPQEPTDRAAERLKQAQQAMEDAQKKLEESKREDASEAQQEALKQLEQAKAELERVLRQLREEEMERTLTMLAARFRKMLDAQTKVYEGTKRVARVKVSERDHDEEVEAARLSREETLIVREADRALVLLREEGSSMAFPETVSLMRDDMQQVSERLAEVKVGMLTQGLEEDIIEALEETIAALDKAIKDLEKKKSPPGQAPPAGQPGDPPLVDKIAELKMIRALQMRINRRTLRYGEVIEDEPTEAPNLLEALAELAQRQQRVYQATHDLSQGRND